MIDEDREIVFSPQAEHRPDEAVASEAVASGTPQDSSDTKMKQGNRT